MAEDSKLTPETNDNKNTENESHDSPALILCEIDVNSIYSLLHKKAIEKSNPQAKKLVITNSAVNDRGEFQGAGQHIIVVVPDNADAKINKDQCIEAIKEYILWFVGPEQSNTISDLTVIAATQLLSDKEKKENSELQKDELNSKDNTSKPDNNEDKSTDISSDTDDSSPKESLNPTLKDIINMLFESTYDEDAEIAQEKGEKVIGYYILYLLEVGNQKVSTVDSNLKKLAKTLGKSIGGFAAKVLGSISMQKYKWGEGGTGDKSTLGNLGRSLKNALTSKIDPEKLKTSVLKQFNKEWPGMNPTFSVFDNRQILNHLKTRLTAKDKTMLKATKHSLCIKVYKNEQNYELLSKQDIADLVTKGVEGRKNKVNKNDVIYVNNYKDNKTDKEANKFIKTKSNESLSVSEYRLCQVLFENSFLMFIENENSDLAKKINAELDSNPTIEKKLLEYSKDLVKDTNSKYTTDDIKKKLGSKTRKTALNTLKLSILKNIIEAINEIKTDLESNDDIINHIMMAYEEYKNNSDTLIDGIDKLKKDIRDVLLKTKGLNNSIDDAGAFKEKLQTIDNRNMLQSILSSFESFNDKYKELSKNDAKTKSKSELIDDVKKKYEKLSNAFETDEKKPKFKNDKKLKDEIDKILNTDNEDELDKADISNVIKQLDQKEKEPNKVTSNKTDVDYYIIPMKNIKFEDVEPDTKPNNSEK